MSSSLALCFLLAANPVLAQPQPQPGAAATPVEASSPSDPLTALLTRYTAPIDESAAVAPAPSDAALGSGERLAKAQSELFLIAEGFEVFRDAAQSQRALASLPNGVAPELRGHFKDRDSTLESVYRTLSVFDFTWALRFPEPPCDALQLRRILIVSDDGLFHDAATERASPWLEHLLGPQPEGKSIEQSLDEAGAVLPLTPVEYETERVHVRRLTEALSSARAQGAARSKLYCERGKSFARLAMAHRRKSGPIAAAGNLRAPQDKTASAVLLVTSMERARYRTLGAAVLIGTKDGDKVITDASVVIDPETQAIRPDLYAFSRQTAESNKLSGPYALTIVTPGDRGLALGRLEGAADLPSLELAASSASFHAMIHGLSHLNAAGAWTRTQGLVTKSEGDWFQSDAILTDDMAGGPLLDDEGRVVGLIVRAGSGPAAVHAYRLREFLDGAAPALKYPDESLVAARGTGSSAILSDAIPLSAQGLSVSDGAPIDAGLPMQLGGVDWNAPSLHVPGPSRIPNPTYSRPSASGGSSSGSGYSSSDSEFHYATPNSPVGLMSRALLPIITLFYKSVGFILTAPAKGLEALREDSRRPTTPAPAPKPEAPPKPLPPPPPPTPKITGLVLTANPTAARPGEIVTLTAALTFEGDYKPRSGIAIKLSVPGDGRSSFAGDQSSVSLLTGADGSVQAVLTLHERTEDSARDAFSALDAESNRQDGEDVIGSQSGTGTKTTSTKRARDAAQSAFDSMEIEEEKYSPAPDQSGDIPNAVRSLNITSPSEMAAEVVVAAASARGFSATLPIPVSKRRAVPRICTDEEFEKLRGDVLDKCGKRSPGPGKPAPGLPACTYLDDCDLLHAKALRFKACAEARRTLSKKCYADNDGGHDQAADDADGAAKNCVDIAKDKKCPPLGE